MLKNKKWTFALFIGRRKMVESQSFVCDKYKNKFKILLEV